MVRRPGCAAPRRCRSVRLALDALGGAPDLAPGGRSLLPENEEVAGWARVWLALHHLARVDDEVASYVAYVRSVERDALGRLAGPDASPDALVELHALVEGLRLQLCSVASADSYREACRLLERALARTQASPA